MLLLLDAVGALLAITCTFLLVNVNRYGWPLGLASNCLNFILFYKTQLYADSFLELYFFFSTLYGWYYWYQADQGPKNQSIKQLTRVSTTVVCTAAAILTISIYMILLNTDSTTPWLDSITCSLSIVAQALLALRYIENWYIWFIADLIYIMLYSVKMLPSHAFIMGINLYLAHQGLITWQRLAKQSMSIKANTAALPTDAVVSD